MATGTILMTVLGCFVNAYVLLPAYGAAFGMPVSKLVGLGTAVNPHITSLSTFVIFAVAPFNLIKGVAVSAIVFVIYKKDQSGAENEIKTGNSVVGKKARKIK